MKKIWYAAVVVVALSLISVGGWIYLANNGRFDLINPLGKKGEEKRKANKPRVIGFLPTWMVGKVPDYSGKIDDMVFLGVDIGPSGNLVWDTQSKKIDNQSYLDLKKKIKDNQGKNILGVKIFNDKDLDKFLADDQAKARAIEEIKAILMVGNFDGVNVDFEYMGDAQRLVDDDFIGWLRQLKATQVGEVSIDVMANTIIKGDSDKLLDLINNTDRTIVMAYDFHRPTSDNAGSVAPINAETGVRNISEITQKIIDSKLPKEKMVMAYPLYGYMWQTATTEIGAATIGMGWMVSYAEAKEKLAGGTWGETTAAENWDELSMTPWVSFSQQVEKTKRVWQKIRGRWKKITQSYEVTVNYQAFYENEKSLGAKMDLVSQNQLGGVAFWALGYEGNDESVWQIVKGKLQSP